MNKLKKTDKAYSFLWGHGKDVLPPRKWHFDYMQEVIDQSIVRGSKGIEIGSGCGYDTYIMASKNPSVEIVSLELSSGVYKAHELTFGLKNVYLLRGSALNLPLKDGIFDFAYSFGVLHHTANPREALSEAVRVIKKNSPVFLYLYEDHSENAVKRIAVKITGIVRKITVKMPHRMLFFLCCAISPVIFMLFSTPAKILNLFEATRQIASQIPFSFATGPFSLKGDLFDRFSVPMEHRFSRQEVLEMLAESGLLNVTITRLKGKSGWVVWGYKS